MNINDNLSLWESKFINYCEVEKLCLANLNNIYEIKQNLIKLLGKQKIDDINFYKSIIDNSYFYLLNSLKIRKIKFLKDLNMIWYEIDNLKHMNEINKINFMALLKDYQKMVSDINYAKENNTILYWVKDDKIESLQHIEKDMNEILIYHTTLIEYLNKIIKTEESFYCKSSAQISDNVQIIPKDNVQIIPNDNVQIIPNNNVQIIPNNNVQIIPKDNVQIIPKDNVIIEL